MCAVRDDRYPRHVQEEVRLDGGNASGFVVRVANTVRKPWSVHTPAVHHYLCALSAAGIDVPATTGRDEQGRQVIEYVSGSLAEESLPLSAAQLARVGEMVRAVHDASESIPIDHSVPWPNLIPAPGADLMCHNDLAPWNLVLGERWVFIDWDASAPSTRLWDLAYAAQAFCLNDPADTVAASAERLAAFVDGYDAQGDLRSALPRAMGDRAAAMHALLERSWHSGAEPWASMFESGHGAHWGAVTAYVRCHEAAWRSALAAAGTD